MLITVFTNFTPLRFGLRQQVTVNLKIYFLSFTHSLFLNFSSFKQTKITFPFFSPSLTLHHRQWESPCPDIIDQVLISIQDTGNLRRSAREHGSQGLPAISPLSLRRGAGGEARRFREYYNKTDKPCRERCGYASLRSFTRHPEESALRFKNWFSRQSGEVAVDISPDDRQTWGRVPWYSPDPCSLRERSVMLDMCLETVPRLSVQCTAHNLRVAAAWGWHGYHFSEMVIRLNSNPSQGFSFAVHNSAINNSATLQTCNTAILKLWFQGWWGH